MELHLHHSRFSVCSHDDETLHECGLVGRFIEVSSLPADREVADGG